MRIKVQHHGATVTAPTPTGPFWAIQVTDDEGNVVLTDWSLDRWIEQPWGVSWDGVTPHRGNGSWVYLDEPAQKNWLDAVGPSDLAELDDLHRLVAGLHTLFPDTPIEVLPALPAPAWPRADRL